MVHRTARMGGTMEDEKKPLELAPSDMCRLTVYSVECVNCIEGYCPARTPAVLEGEKFILCGAKKLSQPVLAAYQERVGIELHIERPC